MYGGCLEQAEAARRPGALGGFAGGQHQPAEAFGVGDRDQLTVGTTGVVAEERHLAEVEHGEKIGDQAGHPGR
jgi:hypothetical protein